MKNNTVFLNNEFISADQAMISPMDRGFLFGEGIYEVIPSYNRQFVGLEPHLDRLFNGLQELAIHSPFEKQQWASLCEQLIERNSGDNLAVYIQVTRGTSPVRKHAYPEGLTPTVFAFTFAINNKATVCQENADAFSVSMHNDLRWQRCHIKSTSLLGNVMHFQRGANEGNQETILFNDRDELTEASSSNVFIVKDNVIATPPLDNQILPGITRHIVLDILRKHSDFSIEERRISRQEVLAADEVWLTSSTKEIAPVTSIANLQVAEGKVGNIWQQAQSLYSKYKHLY